MKFFRRPAVQAFSLVGIVACASSLSSREELDRVIQAPESLNQKIETASQEELAKKVVVPPPLPLPTPTPSPTKVSKKKGVKPAKVTPPAAPVDPYPVWGATQWPFGVGEKITWTMRWGVIEGGNITLSVEEPKVLDGVPVLHYRAQVKSSRLMEFIYRIDDEMYSWVRLADHLPLRQEIHQNESNRQGKRVVVFDPAKGLAKFFSKARLKDGRIEEHLREDPVSHYSQDIFGAMFFYRFIGQQDRIVFPIHDRWRNWANELTFVAKEKIRVPAGEFDALHYKVFPRVQGALQPQGDVEVWLKDDPTKILLKFEAKIKVGSVVGEMKAYEAGRPITLPLPSFRTPTNLSSTGELQVR